MWKIIEQIEKVKKQEFKVKCKNLRFFPIQNNGETAFGRFKFLMLKVILQHEREGKDHFITYNDKGGYNTFIYHWPNKSQGTDSFTSLERLHAFLASRGEIANEVVKAFSDRIGTLTGIRKEAEEKRLAKIAKKKAKELSAA